DAQPRRDPRGRAPAHEARACARAGRARLIAFRSLRREEHDVADRVVAREEHREPVDAEADAAGGRHAVRERLDVVRVALLRLDVARVPLDLLELEAVRLLDGVVDLRERVSELDAAGEVLEA